MSALVWLLALVCAWPAARAQNSTRKIRVEPSALAARAGDAVPWRDSLEAGLIHARERGLPVFWYVPTVPGSPMDRKPEIDRYMLAGPFSWPSTIELLTQQFVPVRAVPDRAEVERYGLRRGEFVEPGWLVLDADGAELQRLDQLTTFHPRWFEAPLRRLAGLPAAGFLCGAPVREAWDAYRALDLPGCLAQLETLQQQQPADAVVAEALYLRGAAQLRSGRPDLAAAAWDELAERVPQSTWAAKAAMEREGHGPFARGFEDYLPLPDRVLRELDRGSRAPRGSYAEPELWRRAVRHLARMAGPDGVLRDSTYDFGGTDSLPNVHLAISFLCGEALLCAVARHQDGRLALGDDELAAAEQLLLRLRAAAADGPFAHEDRDEILWAHAYRARFLRRWLQLRPDDRAAVAPVLRAAVAALVGLQQDDGAWFHEYSNPFAIATALQALAAARDAGVEVPADVSERGVRALTYCRADNGAFTYGYPRRGRARAGLEGAAGRMPLCELALLRWGASGQDALTAALEAAFAHHDLLAGVRKYDDHADRHGYGGFFFWFDMLGRAEATMLVEDAARRGRWQAQQKKLVLDLPEFDGCFVDSHELGRCYGSAMALLCFAALEP